MILSALLAVSLTSIGSPAPVADPSLRLQIEGKGEIVITLRPSEAPLTCARVISLAEDGFYTGQRFHKVVKTPKPFLIQIGDPNSKTKPATDPSLGSYQSGTKIPMEKNQLKHLRGAVGFARLDADRNSGDTQFYILLGDYGFLDGQYTVFGNVTQGMDVVDRIAQGDRMTRVSVSP